MTTGSQGLSAEEKRIAAMKKWEKEYFGSAYTGDAVLPFRRGFERGWTAAHVASAPAMCGAIRGNAECDFKAGHAGPHLDSALDVEWHAYLSTACQHELHDRCRKECKFCSIACRCECHKNAPASEPVEQGNRALPPDRCGGDGTYVTLPPAPDGEPIQRWSSAAYIRNSRCGGKEAWSEMERDADGAYVSHADHLAHMRRQREHDLMAVTNAEEDALRVWHAGHSKATVKEAISHLLASRLRSEPDAGETEPRNG
jgi:hypothetical protein